MILGIDIGGTSAKFGIVSHEGEISHAKRFKTEAWISQGGFINNLADEIGNYLKLYPAITGVGIGWPGLLSADRKKVVLLPNIPSVKDEYVVPLLNSRFPGIVFKIENDAKCAALGEYYFGGHKGFDNYILITLGTGVGSGVVMKGKLFIGVRGNGTEIGHILTHTGKTLEEQVGLKNLVAYAKELLAKDITYKSSLHTVEDLDPKSIQEEATKGDEIAWEVYKHAGRLLGETMVGVIRTLDLDKILIGGGISPAIELIRPEMMNVLKKHLPAYYTDDLQIKQASLSNDAGLLGAAALILEK